jgi:hypothetical protein
MLPLTSGRPQARSSRVSAARTRAECGAAASRITAASVAIASFVSPRAISLTSGGDFHPTGCLTGPSGMVESCEPAISGHCTVHCFQRYLNMVQKWLGHAPLTTTAIYANAVGEEE